MSGILNSVYNNISFSLARQSDALARLQEQATTGSRINRPSDDPSTGYQILTLNTEKSSLDNYIKTLADMTDTLNTSSTVIQTMQKTIGDARVAVSKITSGTYNQDGRNMTAQAINDLLEQLVQFANSKSGDEYLYGGADTSTTPFAVERDENGEITAVTYQGSMENRTTNVAPGVSAGAFYVGQELFSSDNRSTPVFSGNTGATAGTGTSSVTGDAWLTVTFDGTNYQLSIDDGATTVTVPTGGSANQAVTDSRTGKVLYVDSTGINNTGTEAVRVPGTYNAFDILINIRDVLKNERGLSDQQIEQVRNATIGSLEEVQNLLIQKQSSMGSKIGFLGNLSDGLASVKANTEDQTSRLQEADIAQIAIDLSRQEMLYQASLAVAGKMMSLSLLDFIQ